MCIEWRMQELENKVFQGRKKTEGAWSRWINDVEEDLEELELEDGDEWRMVRTIEWRKHVNEAEALLGLCMVTEALQAILFPVSLPPTMFTHKIL